jgi:hypothetical protein
MLRCDTAKHQVLLSLAIDTAINGNAISVGEFDDSAPFDGCCAVQTQTAADIIGRNALKNVAGGS